MRGASAVLVAATILIGACSWRGESLPRPSRVYCETAYRYEQRLERKQASVDSQITMVSKMAANAPKDIAADVAVFLDALRRVEADPSVKGRPKVVTAVENVNRRTSTGCGFFEQDRNTGF